MARLARRSWAPRGQTPPLMQRGRFRRKASVIGALVISPQRRRVQAHFDILPDANFDAASILRFVQAVPRTSSTRIVLVWDRLQAHYAEPMAWWLG